MKERYNTSFSSALPKPEKGNEHAAYVCFNQEYILHPNKKRYSCYLISRNEKSIRTSITCAVFTFFSIEENKKTKEIICQF